MRTIENDFQYKDLTKRSLKIWSSISITLEKAFTDNMYTKTTFGQESMKAYNAITEVLNKMENKRASTYWAGLINDIQKAFNDLWNQDFKDR